LFICCNEMKDSTSNFEDKVLDLIIESSTGEPIEFPEAYNKLADNIADDRDEKLKFVEKLKSKDFKVTNWGRGNHTLGPRIIIITLKRGTCECVVAKIYSSTTEESKYNMIERVNCKKASL